MELAKALKNLRRERNWTLADVSQRSGIPSSTLSKVENGKLSLSYDKLLRLAQGLEVPIERLFNSAAGSPATAEGPLLSTRRSVNRGDSGHPEDTPTYHHVYLSTDLLRKKFDPILAEVKARSLEEFGDFVRHEGEEFAYVLEGEVMFHTEVYAPVHLSQGDSVYFDSAMGHAYIAASEGPCRILSICAGRDRQPPS